MTKLSKIVCDLFFMKPGYLSNAGKRLLRPDSRCAVKCRAKRVRELLSFPDAADEYIMKHGVDRHLDDFDVYEYTLTLRRISDGGEATFKAAVIFLHTERVGHYRSIGFHTKPDGFNDLVTFEMEKEEYLRLAEFLKKAGVEFEPDAPPWMEEALVLIKTKPSSKRPGKEVTRFLGYV